MTRIEQYDFAKNWEPEIVPLKKHFEIKKSFKILRTIRNDMIASLCENGDAVRSDFSAFREDLNWLRENFEGIDLKFLVLEMATRLYPEKEWEIVGWSSEDAVISDIERTLVFDDYAEKYHGQNFERDLIQAGLDKIRNQELK